MCQPVNLPATILPTSQSIHQSMCQPVNVPASQCASQFASLCGSINPKHPPFYPLASQSTSQCASQSICQPICQPPFYPLSSQFASLCGGGGGVWRRPLRMLADKSTGPVHLTSRQEICHVCKPFKAYNMQPAHHTVTSP